MVGEDKLLADFDGMCYTYSHDYMTLCHTYCSEEILKCRI